MKNAIFALFAAVFMAGVFDGQSQADQNAPELGALFGQLQQDIGQYEADAVARQIWRRWLQTDNPVLEQLMQQGIRDMNAADLPAAVEKFTAAINMAPTFAEAWNKRATVYYMMGEYALSTADVAKTLLLEPRHFGALSGQGMIHLQEYDRDSALRYFKRALKVNPHLVGVRNAVDFLKREKDGPII